MTSYPPTVEPRVVTTRRYEFTLPGEQRVVDFDDLVVARDHALAWLRAVPLEPDPADVVVRYAHDGRLVVAYDAPSEERPPATTAAGSALVAYAELVDALGLPRLVDDVSWSYLLDVVRNQAALTTVVARAVAAVNDDDPVAPILALLPRDWPRQLEAQLTDAGNMLGLVGLIKRLVDDWVLAASDVVEAVTARRASHVGVSAT